MIREYVEGHKWNGTRGVRVNGNRYIAARGVIQVDGKLQCFIYLGDTKKEAIEQLKTFANPECICTYPENKYGEDPPCPIHIGNTHLSYPYDREIEN